MLRLDRNDPLDRMILKELNGQPVPFDEWLDAMEELEDEPGCEDILRNKGLRREDVLRDVMACRADFRARLEGWSLPADNRFELCFLLCEHAQKTPSKELLQIYSELLSDPGFLLDSRPQWDDPDYEDQVILQYLTFVDEQRALLQNLVQRRELSYKFTEITKQKRSPRSVSCDTEKKYEILQCFTKLYSLPSKGNGHILLDNLGAYMQIAAASPLLKSVEPLLLFRLLTRRQSYMCSTPDLAVDLPALWKPGRNKIDSDNGRNFKQYRTNLQLFMELCRIYEKDGVVNLPLCWYGLDQITVLGGFYRNQMSKGWEDTDGGGLPFLPTIEELVENSQVSCFENGYGDNVVLEDSGLPVRKLVNFQYSPNPLIVRNLNRISDYINAHAAGLTESFLAASPAEVKTLCRDILDRSKIRGPATASDLPLYLASINDGLLELKDYFAGQYLIQAGHALTDMPAMRSSIPTE